MSVSGKSGLVVHIHTAGTQETQAGDCTLQDNPNYRVRPWLLKKKKK